MLRFRHATLIAIAGAIWLAMGLYLMSLGLRFLNSALTIESHTPLINLLTAWIRDRDYALLLVIVAAMLVGRMKGRTILAKAAGREITRIRHLEDPVSITHLYSYRFYALVVIMMGLGISMKLFDISLDIRGGIDLTVGIALVQGSITYFKAMKLQEANGYL